MSTERTESSGLWRILTTPVGPPILPRFPARLGYKRIVSAAALPAPVADLILATVARTRLWHGERADVARELVAHFADGLAAGLSEEELVRDFGNPADAARLIRRAKKRNRPLIWRAWVRSVQGVAALLLVSCVLYGLLAVRYFTGTARVSRDYLTEIAAPLAAVPEAERAWPLYKAAAAKFEKTPDQVRVLWGMILPGDAQWPEVAAYLERAQGAIAMIHEAAARPRLGVDLRENTRETVREDRNRPPGPVNIPQFDDLMQTAHVDYLNTLQRAASVLHEDALRCAGAGDGAGVMRDLTAIMRIAEHCGEGPFTINGAVSLSVFSNQGLRAAGQILAWRPASLKDADLIELAHRLGSFAGGGTLTLDVGRDRAFFMDLVQRCYTDDGHGDGRLTPAGRQRLAMQRGGPTDILQRFRAMAVPVVNAAAMSRKQVVEAYDRAIQAAQAEAAKPLYARQADPWQRMLAALGPEQENEGIFGEGGLPLVGQLSHQTEVVTQIRDAMLVAIALELYHRAHGAYPASLDELAPVYLPNVPQDRFDGKPIKYAPRNGRPLVYSVAGDGIDDGGKLVSEQWGNRDAAKWVPGENRGPAAKSRAKPGDWILWPPVDYNADGDVIVRE